MPSRWKFLAWMFLVVSVSVIAWPILVPPRELLESGLALNSTSHDEWLPLGTDRWGVPFGYSLARALGESCLFALIGTSGVLFGAVLFGVFESALESSRNRLIAQALTLGAMAIPEVALLVTVRAALPFETSSVLFDAVVLGTVAILWIPPTSRLIASRLQAIRTAPFFRTTQLLGAGRWYLLRKEMFPHLVEDVSWLFATIFPRFIHVEMGLAYIGVEYHFKGLGLILKSSYENPSPNPYLWHLLIASAAAAWVSLLPMLWVRLCGVRPPQ